MKALPALQLLLLLLLLAERSSLIEADGEDFFHLCRCSLFVKLVGDNGLKMMQG